jgi:hypothetical protein
MLSVEAMEARELLSGIMPVLTMHRYNGLVADVRNVMGTLAKTHDFAGAGVSLAGAAAEVPFGRQQLLPTWQGDLGLFSAQVPGSGLAVQAQLINDLNRFLHAGVTASQFRVTGPGSAAFYGPENEQKSVSVRIVNATKLKIKIVATLTGSKPISGTMDVNGPPLLIDFKLQSTDYYIIINVSRADGARVPAPRDITLDRPVQGYNGKVFTLSVFADRFSVSG